MPLATLTIDITAKLANLQTSLDRAAQISEKSAERMKAAFGAANTALAGLGVGVGLGAFVAFTRNAIDAADAANDMPSFNSNPSKFAPASPCSKPCCDRSTPMP